MNVITWTNLKGGVGKTSWLIYMANYLSSIGYKVLVVDMDIQNSITFYYNPDLPTENKNMYQALENGTLKGNIIKPDMFISIIPSCFDLIKLRNIETDRLDKIIKKESLNYDFCLIDTAPTFDSVVLNAINASDTILTPCYLSTWDWKVLLTYRDLMKIETDKIDNWEIIINKYKPYKSDNSETKQYLDMFYEDFDNILNTRLPDTKMVKRGIETKTKITTAPAKINIYNGMQELCKEVLGIENNNSEGF